MPKRIRQKIPCLDCQTPVTERSIRCIPCNTARYLRDGSPNWKGGNSKHPLYSTFNSMKTRCFNKNRDDYKYYGGRGITIYDEWKDDFQAFATWVEENLGPRPERHTLDRIDVDGNYEPGNLRWASTSTQRMNSRPKGMAA